MSGIGDSYRASIGGAKESVAMEPTVEVETEVEVPPKPRGNMGSNLGKWLHPKKFVSTAPTKDVDGPPVRTGAKNIIGTRG